MNLPIYLLFLFINFILGLAAKVDANLHEFNVKIKKDWAQNKEYEYLFNGPIEEAMVLTVYQAKTWPSQPKNGQFEVDENASVSFVFLIPNNWAQSELELRIELAQSGQIILKRFSLRNNEPHSFMPMKEIEISIFSETIINKGAPGENEEHRKMDDPFYDNEIASSIDDVKLKNTFCKLKQKNAVKLFFSLRKNFDTFQIAQIVREYGWLTFYLMKLHALILMEYFVNNQPKFQNFEAIFGPNIHNLAKALDSYRNELLKQQKDGQELGNQRMSDEEAGINRMLNHLEVEFYYTETKHQLQKSSSAAVAAAAYGRHHGHGQLGNVANSLRKFPQVGFEHPTELSLSMIGNAVAETQAPKRRRLAGDQMTLWPSKPSNVDLALAPPSGSNLMQQQPADNHVRNTTLTLSLPHSTSNMKFTIYITLMFIYSILGQHNSDPNLHDFTVKIEKSWAQLKVYEYLFNVEPNEPPAMALTVYKANTNPSVPIKGTLAGDVNVNASVSYEFSIPKEWAKSELELRIELTQSRQDRIQSDNQNDFPCIQKILRCFTLRRIDPQPKIQF